MGKPSYLKLLNTIAVNEKKGEIFLSAWADSTEDEELAAALRFVAIREGEHAWAFTKRMCELGYAVAEDEAFNVFKDFDALLDCVCSEASDADKVRYINAAQGGDGNDPFGRFFEDTTIDPDTGALLGRYIAEERDSGRRLQAAYDAVLEKAGSEADNGASPKKSEDLDELRATIKALKKEVKALKRLM